jgi:hypothetical protein
VLLVRRGTLKSGAGLGGTSGWSATGTFLSTSWLSSLPQGIRLATPLQTTNQQDLHGSQGPRRDTADSAAGGSDGVRGYVLEHGV